MHFGDLGSIEIDYDLFKDTDIALIPVGGTFTIDAEAANQLIEKISPKITIPMHFKTPKLGFGIDSAEPFLSGKDYQELDNLQVSPQNIGSFKKVVVLKHQR